MENWIYFEIAALPLDVLSIHSFALCNPGVNGKRPSVVRWVVFPSFTKAFILV